MRHQLIISYFWPEWNSCVRLGVFHPIFSTKEVTFLYFSHNLSLKFLIFRLLTSVASCTCFWPDKAHVHPRSSTRFGFQVFLSFFSKPEVRYAGSSTLFSPYAGVRGDPLHPQRSTPHTPHHAIRATHVSAYTPPPRYIDTTYGYQFAPWPHDHRRQCVSCIGNRGRLDLSYVAGASRRRREAGRYVCCWCDVVRDVEGGGGLPVRRHSYKGHRVQLWISDWPQNDKKTVEREAE